MPIHPTPPKFATAPIIRWLGAFILCFSAFVADGPAERSSAYLSYRDYLNYHRAKIDSELHPDLESRAGAAAQAAKLKPAAEKQDIDALRSELKSKGEERRTAIAGLRATSEDLATGVLQSETKLLELVKRRDDESVPAENKPSDAEIAGLESRLAWLKARAEFCEKETAAFAGKPSAADRAGDVYSAFIMLEEARQLAEFTTDTERKRLAEASFEIQSQRLRGETIGAARDQLPPRQIAIAAHELNTKLKAIPNRIRALANRHPEESNRLLALQKFYEAELESLRELRTAKKGR